MDSLRIEKAYRSWGHDLGGEDTPLEAGLGFAVRFDKPQAFTGRDALLAQREKPLARRLIVFALDAPEPLLYHDEPIWRDGALVGRIASGAYGHTVGRSVGLGWVSHPDGVTDGLLVCIPLPGRKRYRMSQPSIASCLAMRPAPTLALAHRGIRRPKS